MDPAPGGWIVPPLRHHEPPVLGDVADGDPQQARGRTQRGRGGVNGPPDGHRILREPVPVASRRPGEAFGERVLPRLPGPGEARCRYRIVPTRSRPWSRRAWAAPEARAAAAPRGQGSGRHTHGGGARDRSSARPRLPLIRGPSDTPRASRRYAPGRRQRVGSQVSSSVAWARTRCRRARRVSASSGARSPSSSASARSSGPSIRVSR